MPSSDEDVVTEGEDDLAPHAAMPDSEFPEDEMPLEERLTLRKVHAQLEDLLERTRQGFSADEAARRASQMQCFLRGPLDSAG